MPKRNGKSKKKLQGNGRKYDATRWLRSRDRPHNLVSAYVKRYGVTEIIAREELISIGYYEEILIQEYESEGIEWKYMVDPWSGEMFVVPESAEEDKLYEFHPFT